MGFHSDSWDNTQETTPLITGSSVNATNDSRDSEKSNNVLAGLRPDSQRYFDYHHAANDTFDAINKRELELGAFAMTSLIYLFDKYGINN